MGTFQNRQMLAPKPRILSERNACETSEGQCDCACASLALPSVGFEFAASKDTLYASEKGLLIFPLANDYQATISPAGSTAALNDSALAVVSYFNEAHQLRDIPPTWSRVWGKEAVQSTIEQLLLLGILIPEARELATSEKVATDLAAWLHVTDRCNMRCAYCYLPHDPCDMSRETGQRVVESIVRSALARGYSSIKLKYAGGEPLLRFPLIVQLHQFARLLSARYGITLKGTVLSNGTLLTAEMIETMRVLGLRLMISLDGLDEYHNCQRHFTDGKGSFTAVAHAIELALEHGLVPDISITVSGRNVEGLPKLMKWVLEHDLPFSLNFYRENARTISQADLRLEEERLISGMRAAYQVIEANLPRRSLLASLVDRANFSVPHNHPCSAGRDYLVFDHLGRVAKCQMAMSELITDASDPDPLNTLQKSTKGIRNICVDDKTDCRSCNWRYWCAGGCPLQAYGARERYDAKSPNCGIYSALYPEVVRLEGLRLLKYSAAHYCI